MKEFTKIFQSHVTSLSFQKRFDLAISICEKLFSDYQDFSLKNEWGDPEILLDAIKLCKLYNINEASLHSLKEMLPKVENITPDTEDFENASYALNACTAVSETLEFLINKNPSHIMNIGTYFTDTIYFKIQDSSSESELANHPMMVEAREFLMRG